MEEIEDPLTRSSKLHAKDCVVAHTQLGSSSPLPETLHCTQYYTPNVLLTALMKVVTNLGFSSVASSLRTSVNFDLVRMK